MTKLLHRLRSARKLAKRTRLPAGRVFMQAVTILGVLLAVVLVVPAVGDTLSTEDLTKDSSRSIVVGDRIRVSAEHRFFFGGQEYPAGAIKDATDPAAVEIRRGSDSLIVYQSRVSFGVPRKVSFVGGVPKHVVGRTESVDLAVENRNGNGVPGHRCKVTVWDQSGDSSVVEGVTEGDGVCRVDISFRSGNGTYHVEGEALVGDGPSVVTGKHLVEVKSAPAALRIQNSHSVVRSGKAIDFWVLAVNKAEVPVEAVAISATMDSDRVTLEAARRDTTTNVDGLARINLTFRGPPGASGVLRLHGGGAHVDVQVKLVAGEPARLLVVKEPPPSFRSDMPLDSAPVVRLLDSSGNPIPGKDVRAILHYRGDTDWKPLDIAQASGDTTLGGAPRGLYGASVVRTDENGDARFDGLGIVGLRGVYQLEFQHLNNRKVNAFSTMTVFRPDESLNRSTVVVSAIKSISGIVPSNEFFDVRMRVRLWSNGVAMGGSDIPLSASTDALTSAPVTDAFLFIGGEHVVRKSTYDIPERSLSYGGIFRVFDAVPYLGVACSGAELAGSALSGSSLLVGAIWPFEDHPSAVVSDGDEAMAREVPPHALLFDFFLRSSEIDFFKSLTIRGGVRLNLHNGTVASRIAVAVPVGTINLL